MNFKGHLADQKDELVDQVGYTCKQVQLFS